MASEKILLVDDDPVIQKMVGASLQKSGYQVQVASNGVEALQIVRMDVPDLVITDVRMPELNGLELTARLRSHHRTARVPIILLSVMTDAKDVLVGYSAGADEYMPKPFQVPILVAKVESLLRRVHAATGDNSRPVGKVMVFLRGKGGVGVTTAAVNLALALSEDSAASAAIFDLNVEFATAGVYLDLKPTHSLADLANTEPSRVDDVTFNSLITTHPTGVRLLVGSNAPENAELVTVPAVQLAIDRLRASNDFVLVDAPLGFNERNLAVIDVADLICVMGSCNLPGLKATRDCLLLLDRLRLRPERLMLLLNNVTQPFLNPQQIVRVLGRTPDHVVSYSAQCEVAANYGRPLIGQSPEDPAVGDIRRLATLVRQRLTQVVPV